MQRRLYDVAADSSSLALSRQRADNAFVSAGLLQITGKRWTWNRPASVLIDHTKCMNDTALDTAFAVRLSGVRSRSRRKTVSRVDRLYVLMLNLQVRQELIAG
jgi:hypothetical protein